MNEFIAITTSFPTNLLSIAMIVAACFWLLTIIGLADIDSFEFDVDVDVDLDADASGVGLLNGLLLKFGLHGIPITLVLSALILVSWLLCYLGSAYILVLLPGSILKALGGILLIALCFMLAMPIVGMSLRPIKPLFDGATSDRKDSLVGKSCTLRSPEVGRTSGQAELLNVGASMILEVRADEPNSLGRGDRVAIISYDAEGGTYKVMSEAEFMEL